LLHAPTEELRDELVPVDETIGLTAVMEAAAAYLERTGRQVTYEYVLLGRMATPFGTGKSHFAHGTSA
jgi:23S rRNA (adenine2503-C2)-methyltransferase